MCGIVGLVTKNNYGFIKGQEDAFYEMLVADTVRGDDSTGMIAAMKDGNFGILKDQWAGHWCADAFRSHELGKELFSKGKAAIGHNRKATIGKISSKTAHPFVVDDHFAMVHNGTLRNHKTLADTTVDSEALAIHLSKVLTEDFKLEVFEEAMGKVEGAYAVMAYNQKTHKVYAFRNAERPLSLIETPSEFVFSSELGLSLWITGRNSLAHKDMKYRPLDVHTLYVIDLKTNKLEETKFVPKKPTTHQPTTQAGGVVIYTKKGTTSSEPANTLSEDEVSKNQFKRFRKQWSMRTITFWADDFVEKNFPRTIQDGEKEVLVMGECDDITISHTIQCEVNMDDIGDESNLLQRMYTGRIYDIEYNRTTASVTIKVDRVKQIPASNALAKVLKDEQAPTTMH